MKNTLTELLNIGIVPIVNENDVISQRTVPLTDATVILTLVYFKKIYVGIESSGLGQ